MVACVPITFLAIGPSFVSCFLGHSSLILPRYLTILFYQTLPVWLGETDTVHKVLIGFGSAFNTKSTAHFGASKSHINLCPNLISFAWVM